MDWLDLQVSREVGAVHGLAHARLPAFKRDASYSPPHHPLSTCLPYQQHVQSSQGILEDSGLEHDQGRRPKPIRPTFSELANLECQVYSDSMGHLSRVIEKDNDVSPDI